MRLGSLQKLGSRLVSIHPNDGELREDGSRRRAFDTMALPTISKVSGNKIRANANRLLVTACDDFIAAGRKSGKNCSPNSHCLSEGLDVEPEYEHKDLGAKTMRVEKSIWIATIAFLLTAVVMGPFAVSDAMAQKGGGGKGGGGGGGGGEDPPAPVAPVDYALRRFVMPADYVPKDNPEVSVRGINNHAEVVGYYDVGAGDNNEQPFYYDGQAGGAQATNLNDLTYDPMFAIPDDWYILAALDINDLGEIAGALVEKGDPDQLRGCVIEMRPAPIAGESERPRLHLLPDGKWSHTYASRINDDGTILGRGDAITSYVYRLGDTGVEVLPYAFDAFDADLSNSFSDEPAQVLSRWPYQLYTLGDAAPQALPVQPNSLLGLADTGAFCGSRTYADGSRGGFWFDGTVHDVPGFNVCADINNAHDVLVTRTASKQSQRLFSLLHADYGELSVDAMIVAQSEAELDIWTSALLGQMYLSERAAVPADAVVTDAVVNEFPIIGGRLRRPSGKFTFSYDGYVLLPVSKAAN